MTAAVRGHMRKKTKEPPCGPFARKGTTLMEMLLVSLIFGILMTSIISLQGLMLRSHSRQDSKQTLLSSSFYAIKSIQSDITEADRIIHPRIGDLGSDILVGIKNVHPLDNSKPLVPGITPVCFFYCTHPETQVLYRYTFKYPLAAAADFDSIECGRDLSEAETMDTVVNSAKTGTHFEAYFSRSEYPLNVISIKWKIKTRAGEFEFAGTSMARLDQFPDFGGTTTSATGSSHSGYVE